MNIFSGVYEGKKCICKNCHWCVIHNGSKIDTRTCHYRPKAVSVHVSYFCSKFKKRKTGGRCKCTRNNKVCNGDCAIK